MSTYVGIVQARNARELGAIIRRGRRARGWSQQALATAAGVTRPTVAAVESGKDTARVGLAFRLLGALGLDVDVRPRTRTRGTIDLDDYLDHE
jgi:transcriptional regulator with XRE-family HTH domain